MSWVWIHRICIKPETVAHIYSPNTSMRRWETEMRQSSRAHMSASLLHMRVIRWLCLQWGEVRTNTHSDLHMNVGVHTWTCEYTHHIQTCIHILKIMLPGNYLDFLINVFENMAGFFTGRKLKEHLGKCMIVIALKGTNAAKSFISFRNSPWKNTPADFIYSIHTF